MPMSNIDPNQLMSLLTQAQQNPQMLDQLAGQLASNPQMAPPPPGSMQNAMNQVLAQTGQGGMSPEALAGGQPPPMIPGTQTNPMSPPPMPQAALGQLLAPQAPMPDITQGPATMVQGVQTTPSAQTEEAERMKRMMALSQLKSPEAQRQLPPAYISNLGFGAATPAKGLGLQGAPGGRVGALGQYL